MKRVYRSFLFYVIILLVVIGLITFFTEPNDKTEKMTYDKFTQHLQSGDVTELKMQPEGGVYSIEGKLSSYKDKDKKFVTNTPQNEKSMNQILSKSDNVKINVEPKKEQSALVTFFVSIVPFVIIGLFLFFIISQMQGGGGGGRVMNFGKSKAKLYSEDQKKQTFKDVAGADEEKQELVEVVDFLKDPRKFSVLGAKIPKGVLLIGPPGTGKTLLARAVAGEAGVPFFSISGSDFVEMFVGVGASRVRDLFENAKKNAPCIIFIDEIDAVGRQRGAGLGGGHDEREQTLNQLLVEMDGFGDNEGIIIIAATNRPDILDPALLRPGRFDRQIPVNRPDLQGREDILVVHSKNKPFAEDVDNPTIAKLTAGFTGADLENLLNEAALLAARFDQTEITMENINEAIERVMAGPQKKSRQVSKKERNIVAFHESGHAIIGMVLDSAEDVHKVTIIPRGQAGGYTVPLPKEERGIITEQELLDKIVGLLGGRVAEEVTFNEVTTGASNDFQRATEMARRMVTEFGMSKLGPMQFGENQGGQVFLGRDIQNEQNYSDQIAYEIDQETRRIINESYERCKEILTKHQEQLKLVSETLLDVETLEGEEIRGLFETGKLPEGSPHSEQGLARKREEEKKKEAEQAKKAEEPEATNNEQDMKVNINSKKDDDEDDNNSKKDDEDDGKE